MSTPNILYLITDDEGADVGEMYFYDIGEAEDYIENYELEDVTITRYARVL